MKTQYPHTNQLPTSEFAKRRTYGLPSALRRQALSGRSAALLALIAALSIFLAYAPTAQAQASADATLSALTLQAGEQTLVLDSEFASSDIEYAASVDSDVPWLTVIPTAKDSNATIMVKTPVLTVATAVNRVAATAAVDSVAVSPLLLLNIGDNAIEVEVTSADKSNAKIYTVTVTRDDGGCNESNTGIKPTQKRLLADCATLLGLKDTLDSGTGLNWAATDDIASWDGITISGDSITQISLLTKELSGVIPPELGSLTDLTSLNIRDNQLTGKIPSQLGALTALTSLDIRNNQLIGEIPPELGSLTALASLILSDNQLSGAIPEELGSLMRLRYLHLDNNQLSGEIPPELGDLTALTSLLLSDNELSGEIPTELSKLTALTLLHLDNNDLTGEIPTGLGIASMLDLYLHCNELTGSIPADFANIQRSIWLQGNPLNSIAMPAGLADDKVRLIGAKGTWDAAAWCGPPTFAEDSVTRTVAEGTPSGDIISEPVKATDPDELPLPLPVDHALTYSLSGEDAFYFNIDIDSGQLRVGDAALSYHKPADADGNNDYELTVTVSDGVAADDNGGTASIDVTVRVTHNAVADATLSKLEIFTSSSTPTDISTLVPLDTDFDPGTIEYTASVKSEVDSVVVTPTATNPRATITVTNLDAPIDASDSSTSSLALVIGSNEIAIYVTPEDKSTAKTYTVTITRAADTSTVAELGSLTIITGTTTDTTQANIIKSSEITLMNESDNPIEFDKAIITYTATVPVVLPHGVTLTHVTVFATSTGDGIITVDGVEMIDAPELMSMKSEREIGSGADGDIVEIEIVVTAAGDPNINKTYTIKITRKDLRSADATLSPSFDSTELIYTASVANSVDSVTVTPTANAPNAPIRAVIPGSGSAFVAGGSASPDRDLVVATSAVRTTVTAEDGFTQQIL